ncbi:MAG: hypothetical protein KF862_04010 [Chitinophagaceae bacterium]|nr:hypothetical protein [Chitinophagaceae bacterium]
MNTVKKHTANRSSKKVRRRVAIPKAKVVVVTKTEVPFKDVLFPEKLKKANEMLAKTTFLP